MSQPVNTDNPTPTLESVKSDFLNWRLDPHRTHQIPESLWNKVIKLLSYYSKTKVLRSLGISYRQLEKKLKSCQQFSDEKTNLVNPKKSLEKPTQENPFIKAIFESPVPSITCFNVVLKKPNGALLQIQKLSQADLLKLTEQFVR